MAYISETIELNQKRMKNLLNNLLCCFQIRKDPTSDIGTLKREKVKDAVTSEQARTGYGMYFLNVGITSKHQLFKILSNPCEKEFKLF
jgi:hypothetical protein